MADRVPWHQGLTYRTGVNDTFTVADSDIVTRLRKHVRGDYEKTSEFMLSEAADEIERLRNECDKLKSIADDFCKWTTHQMRMEYSNFDTNKPYSHYEFRRIIKKYKEISEV